MIKQPQQHKESHRPSEILEALRRLEFGAAVAVPDGWLGEFLVRIEQEPTMRLVRATHEEEALAIACGIRLGGVRTALIVQNAGLLSMGAGMVCLAPEQFPQQGDQLQDQPGDQQEECIHCGIIGQHHQQAVAMVQIGLRR